MLSVLKSKTGVKTGLARDIFFGKKASCGPYHQTGKIRPLLETRG